MNLEQEIYQILRKHRLGLKKREELIVDLLDFINKREKAITVTRCCTELKDDEVLTFDLWMNKNDYSKDLKDVWSKDGFTLDFFELNDLKLQYERL